MALQILLLLVGIACAQYTADWDSLNSRPLPAWYDQVKFGIFIHWGVFSVPSWGTDFAGGSSGEWFWYNWIVDKDPAYVAFMKTNYAPGYQYQDFANDFTAELFDPHSWAELFRDAGAKYVVLTSKHHEGWTNWNSNYSWNWNSVNMGPHRDLVAEVTDAVRDVGLHMGLYHSLYEWFHPLYLMDKANNYTTSYYVDQVLQPELNEIVMNYKPEIIWADGDWEANDTYWQSTDFLAWLYNDSPVSEVVCVNDRWGEGDQCVNGGYYTCNDRYNPGTLQGHKWENCMTIDRHSWGFRRNAHYFDYLNASEIITQLVSTVSCGGNLLLNVGPTLDGIINPIFRDRLYAIGAWLKVNGEAIYYTDPWRSQNDTLANVWYTAAGETVYAIALSWPKDNVLVLTQPKTSAQTQAIFILDGKGSGIPLGFNPNPLGYGMNITMPNLNVNTNPSTIAWTIKLLNVS